MLCNVGHTYILFIKIIGLSDCSGGVTISGQCFKSVSETSWHDARNRCLNEGGDMATFDDITTNAGFHALNGSLISASIGYWIGFRRESYTWQSSSTFSNHDLPKTFNRFSRNCDRKLLDCMFNEKILAHSYLKYYMTKNKMFQAFINHSTITFTMNNGIIFGIR